METESEMRVIAGKARRLNLKTIPGIDTRPTTDRIKETLFNMIQYDIAGCTFLDLFSGSGAIGIFFVEVFKDLQSPFQRIVRCVVERKSDELFFRIHP